MNDIVTTPAELPTTALGFSITDVISKDELQAMPLGMRIMFVPALQEQFKEMARQMAADELTRPHLQKNPSACFAVIRNALNWRMDPHAVAGKTYSPAAGQIGIEGVLASAIMLNSGRISHITYEHVGDWSKVENNFKEIDGGQWPNGKPKRGKIVADWKPEDEKGLGCIGTAHMKNGQEIIAPTVFLAQCHPRNATTWPTAPARQIIHVVERTLCNMVCGDILMGVHIDVGMTRTFEEQEPAAPKDITPAKAIDPREQGIRGAGETEPMTESGYAHDEDGVVIEEPRKRSPRVKLMFRGKEMSKTNFVKDVRHLIRKHDDFDDLVRLEKDVWDACQIGEPGNDIFADLKPHFKAAHDEYEDPEQEEAMKPQGMDLTGGDEE